MIIDNVIDFLKTCPLLADREINVDFLADEASFFTIDTLPCEPVLKKYVGGGELCQAAFVLAGREFYTGDYADNIANVTFYEQLTKWIEKSSREDSLPVLDGGRTAQSMEVITSGYLFSEEQNRARYQLQIRLVYTQDI